MSTFTFRTVPPPLTQTEFNAERQEIADRLNGITLDGVRSYPCTYIVRKNGSVYEAIDSAHNLAVGGADDAGGADGDSFEAVYTAVDSACSNGDKIVLGSNSTFVGDIIVTKRITLEGLNSCAPTIQGSVTVDSDYVTLRDFIIDPGSASVDGLVLGTDCNYCHFENVRVNNARYGVYKSAANSEGICNLFLKMDIRNCVKGVFIDYVDGAYRFNSNVFQRCTVSDCDEQGMLLCDGASVLIQGCDVENNGQHGIDLQSIKDVCIHACYLENNAQSASTYSEIHGITNAAGSAPFCNYIKIDSCYIYDTTYADIAINFEARVSNWEIQNTNVINTGKTNTLKTAATCTYGFLGLLSSTCPNSLGTYNNVTILSDLPNIKIATGIQTDCVNETEITHGLGQIPSSVTLTIRGDQYPDVNHICLPPSCITRTDTTFVIKFYAIDITSGVGAWALQSVGSGEKRDVSWIAIYNKV